MARPYVNLDINKLIEMYTISKMPVGQIAIAMGCGVATVCRRLKENNIEIVGHKGRSFPSKRKVDSKTAAGMYAQGASSTQIAEAFSATPTAVLNSLRRGGVQIRAIAESNSLIKRGNKGVSSHGYVRVNTGNRTRQYEHILKAEQALGRKLKKGEVVHHINGDQTDNRNSNLLVCTHKYHLDLHKRIRAKYGKGNYPFNV